MLVLSSDLIDAMKYFFGYNGYLANVAMMAIIEISAMLAIISRNMGANKPGSKSTTESIANHSPAYSCA